MAHVWKLINRYASALAATNGMTLGRGLRNPAAQGGTKTGETDLIHVGPWCDTWATPQPRTIHPHVPLP